MLNQRLTERKQHSGVAMSSYDSLLVRVIKLLFNALYPEPPEDEEEKLAHLSQWEREKVMSLGLSVNSSSQNYHQKQHLNFNSWGKEKVAHFDLTDISTQKNTYRNQTTKQKQVIVESSPKTSDIKPQKQQSKPVSVKAEREIDDFFKILGYE
jgi:hypothetical protein